MDSRRTRINFLFSVRLGSDEEGVSMVDCALLLALVAIACIAAMSALGSQISNCFSSLSTSV